MAPASVQKHPNARYAYLLVKDKFLPVGCVLIKVLSVLRSNPLTDLQELHDVNRIRKDEGITPLLRHPSKQRERVRHRVRLRDISS